ncbi:MAG: radical SAM protein [Nanoarchaeota archaeon]|nr:radical SAM protein [Nanoarchaeota archaeon]
MKTSYAKLSTRFLKSFVKTGLGFYSPFVAYWETTYRCNARCEYCSIGRIGTKHYPSSKELSTEESLKLVDDLHSVGVSIINFNGAESLLRKDIIKLIDHAKSKGMMTILGTNGLLLSKRINGLKDCLDVALVLLDSHIPEVNDDLRKVKNAFNKTVEGIKKAVNAGIDVNIRCFVNQKNKNELGGICELAQRLGVNVHLQPIIKIPVDFEEVSGAEELAVTPKEYIRIVRNLKKKYSCVKTSKAYLNFVDNGGFFNKMPCSSARNTISVKPDGSIAFPCAFYPLKRFDARKLRKLIKTNEFKECLKNEKHDFCENCILSCYFVPALTQNLFGIPRLTKLFLKDYFRNKKWV